MSFCYIKDRKAKFCKKFAILRTEKLSFARICYVKDRKAMICKNLLCEGPKSHVLQGFKDRKAIFCKNLLYYGILDKVASDKVASDKVASDKVASGQSSFRTFT